MGKSPEGVHHDTMQEIQAHAQSNGSRRPRSILFEPVQPGIEPYLRDFRDGLVALLLLLLLLFRCHTESVKNVENYN